MLRTYGIPNIIQASHLFRLNDGAAVLRVDFKNGIIDPSAGKPATFRTDNEAVQRIIEDSPLFGKEIFCYDGNGKKVKINRPAPAEPAPVKKAGRPAKQAAPESKPETTLPDNVYPNVKTIGDATEQLLALGATASQLKGMDGLLDTMAAMGVVFPNLSLK